MILDQAQLPPVADLHRTDTKQAEVAFAGRGPAQRARSARE